MVYNHKQSFKEVVRHLLFRSGLYGALTIFRRWRGQDTGQIRKQHMADVFSHVYANKVWVMHEKQESLSGLGSTQIATDELVVQLSKFLKDVGCRKLIDIGCGDFNWMRTVDGDFSYLGIDVVPSVVEKNNVAYANEKRQFICMDASQMPIEDGDVAICREVLFHLSFASGLQLLRNINAAGVRHVILTNDKSVWFNSDIYNGDFRPINLLKPPFRLPRPQYEMKDDRVLDGRVLGVWAGKNLPV